MKQDLHKEIEWVAKEDHKEYFKALIHLELGISNEIAIERMYEKYMDDDNMLLLNDAIYKLADKVLSDIDHEGDDSE